MRIFEIAVPIIAAVQGSAVGGGVGLACAADFRVASPSTRFHANFSALGFRQGFGLSVTLPEIVGLQQTLRAPLVQKVRAALERELSEQARLWATEDVKFRADNGLSQTALGKMLGMKPLGHGDLAIDK